MTDTGLKKISIILVTCILVAVIGVCVVFVIRNTPQTLNTQKNATSVIAELYKNKNKYIGDASADGKILRLLGSIDGTVSMGIELQTENEPYILIRKFRGKPTDITQAENQAAIILALIDNAGSVEYVFDKETYSYKRSDVEKKYNIVLSK
ncbi:MAG: DUF4825 domain-containing protein, partial [Bacillota bacterium]|nr:DUF4825 domain-containing protein [Bacillota bacterium]